MQLQQLRYVIAVAESGSMNAVAKSLFISQSSLSVAVRDLEAELGITIFIRTSKGITLTSEGVEFMGYARQVVEQADLMERHYKKDEAQNHKRFSVSLQHYAFAVRAFIDFVHEADDETVEFSLHETRTNDIIEDVRTFKSDIGILYLSNFNEHVLKKRFSEASLNFYPLFIAKPHVFVGKHHPLAEKETIALKDLEPYPRLGFEQGPDSSLYLSEEPLSTLTARRHIRVSDRATMTSLLLNYDGYLLSTGVLSDETYEKIVARPLDVDEHMCVGYIVHSERKLAPLAQAYLEKLKRMIAGLV